MLRATSLAAGACAVLMLAFACKDREEPVDVSAAAVREETREAASAAANYAETQRRALEQRAQRVVTDVDRELTDARVQLSSLSGEAEQKLDAAIDRAEAARETLGHELDELTQATADGYKDASARVTDALAEMDEARREVATALAGHGATQS